MNLGAFTSTHERAHCPATKLSEGGSAVPCRKRRMWLSSLTSDFRTTQCHIQGHRPLHSKDWELYGHFTHETIAGGGIMPQGLTQRSNNVRQIPLFPIADHLESIELSSYSILTNTETSRFFYLPSNQTLASSSSNVQGHMATYPREGKLTECLQPTTTP